MQSRTIGNVETHEDAENRWMVEGVGEHTLAAADKEALDATKQEEWRARRDSPARVVVVSLGYRERVREREPTRRNQG